MPDEPEKVNQMPDESNTENPDESAQTNRSASSPVEMPNLDWEKHESMLIGLGGVPRPRPARDDSDDEINN